MSQRMKVYADINSSMLEWGRNQAELSLEEAASKLNLSSSAKSTAVQKLKALEDGSKRPTKTQLFKFASVYRHPLTLFYLTEPPRMASRGVDYRQMMHSISTRERALLNTVLRDVSTRQSMVRTLLEDDEDFSPLSWVASVSSTTPKEQVLRELRELLDVPNHATLLDGVSTQNDLFNKLRTKVEDLGVFVLLKSDCGSYHTRISAEVFRGFAIADPIAPFIVINNQDAKVNLSFTLIHEFCRILLSTSGISNAFIDHDDVDSDTHVEKFCNDLAGQFLLPNELLTSVPNALSLEEARQLNAQSSKDLGVEESLIAYRLHRLNKIPDETYEQLRHEFKQRWLSDAEDRSSTQATRNKTDSIAIQHRRSSNSLLRLVCGSIRSGTLTYTKAATILGVNPTSVGKLIATNE